MTMGKRTHKLPMQVQVVCINTKVPKNRFLQALTKYNLHLQPAAHLTTYIPTITTKAPRYKKAQGTTTSDSYIPKKKPQLHSK